MFVDMHCDTMLKIRTKFDDFDFSITEAYEMGGGLQLFACYIDVQKEKNPFRKAVELINNFKAVAEADPRIEIAYDYDDIIAITEKNKVAALLAIEDCGILDGNLENLHTLYQMGVRLATLTWNFENEVAFGSKSVGGIKPFGISLLKEMEKLHMVADVSHINRQGFYDVLKYSNRPVLATHSCSYEVFPHERNLNRHQFRELAQTGGIAGINFYPVFLNGTPYADISDVISHISYFLEISQNSVGFGSDFDGVKYLPSDLKHTKDIKTLCCEIERFHGTEIMQKISYQNMLDFLRKNL